MRRTNTILVLLSLLCFTVGCDRKAADAKRAFTADVRMDDPFLGNMLTGKLYLSNGHLRVDWGAFADVFDLKQRNGFRLIPGTKSYMYLGNAGELSTYAPEMTNGSICPHAQVPSACKLLAQEEIDGRMANKWDVWNPQGFHVYVWTDDTLDIAVRSEIGRAKYEVKGLRDGDPIPREKFTIPADYMRVDKWP